MADLRLPPEAAIREQVRLALIEDLGTTHLVQADRTAALIPAQARSRARLLCRETAVLAGRAWFDEVFRQLDPGIAIRWNAADGDRITENQVLCDLEGPSRALLTGERTAMNLLQTLSGTATTVRRYVDAVAGAGVRILDTRKTIPGLRLAQKYAVTCGGGANHRFGLYDAILIKENHIEAAGSIAAAVTAARALSPGMEIEVEVETPGQLQEALAIGVPRILLDNFDLPGLRDAVRLNHGRARLEASGGVDFSTLRAIAETGIDDISIGALTKHVTAIDLSMRFLPTDAE